MNAFCVMCINCTPEEKIRVYFMDICCNVISTIRSERVDVFHTLYINNSVFSHWEGRRAEERGTGRDGEKDSESDRMET